MMSLEAIRAESNAAARRSARQGLTPLVVWDPEEVFGAPFLGTRVPRGWRVLRYDDLPDDFGDRHGFYGNDDLGVLLFADASGFGSEGEPALTRNGLLRAVEDILNARTDLTIGWAVYEAGQFQVHVRPLVKR